MGNENNNSSNQTKPNETNIHVSVFRVSIVYDWLMGTQTQFQLIAR